MRAREQAQTVDDVPEGVVDAVLRAVDHDRLLGLVQEVCRIPSILGEEGRLAQFLGTTLRESGFEGVDLQPVLPERPNAVGHVDFGPGPRVVLTGHMDTKPVSHGWTVTAPFSGERIDGRIYGHGIMDMKAALACKISAVEAVRNAGIELSGVAAVAAVSDHMGDQRGSIAYFDEYRADLCLLGELSNNQICLGHRGRYYFDVTALGRSAHTCHKDLAVNANVLAAQAILQLDASRLEPALEDWVETMFGGETYIVPGRVYGGLPPGGPSMIPDVAVIRVDCRPQPGVSVQVVQAEIDRCLDAVRSVDSRFRATVELVDVKDAYLADPEAEVVRHLANAVQCVRGEEPTFTVAGWLGDTASFGHKVPTVIFGPGGEPVYCPDENLDTEEIIEATRVYALFLAHALYPRTTEATVAATP